MRRAVMLTALIVSALVAAVAASARSYTPAKHNAPAKLTVWVGWSARELGEFKKVVAEYDSAHPDVTVKVVGSINDDKITNAIRSGNPPDVVSSFTSANVGIYCGTGAWIDLAPFLKKDHIALSQFPKTSLYYTQFKGKRCALPLLADSYGLYYNKTLFAKAGISRPPKTFTELTADAKKLTQRSGSNLKVVGYDPFWGFYSGNFADMTNYAPLFGAKYLDSKGKSQVAKQFAFAKILRWQKSLVDWYGYDNLVRFQAKPADEFSASNAFETGRIAMLMDGEWRVAFIHAEHPELKY